jgi:hypothetical protein
MMRAVPDSEMSGEAVVLPAMPNEDTSKLPLLFEEGQVVEVQRRNEARPGWLEVTYHRLKHGLFPESRLLLTRLLGELLKENPETLAKVGALELIQSHRRAVGESPSSPLGENESIRGGKYQDPLTQAPTQTASGASSFIPTTSISTVPNNEMHGEAIAIQDFATDDKFKLPLRKGQRVFISFRDRLGWLAATDEAGREGRVPGSSVVLIRMLNEEQKKELLDSDDDSDEPAGTIPRTQSDSDESGEEEPTEDASTSAQYNPDETAPGLSEHSFGTVMTLQLRDNMRATPDDEMHGNAIALMDFELSDPGYGHQNEIPLSKGQRIDVTSRYNEEYLNIRDRHGREGVAPESFVVLTEFLSYEQEDYLDRIFSRNHGHTGGPLMRAPLLKNEENKDQELPTISAPTLSSSNTGEQRGSSQIRVNPLPDPRTLDYHEIDFTWFARWWRVDQAIKEQQGLTGLGGRQASQQFDGVTKTRKERDNERDQILEAYDDYKTEMQAKMSTVLWKPVSDLDSDDPETKSVPADTEDGFYAEATSDFVPEHNSQMGLQKGRLVWVESVVDEQWALAQDTDTDGTRIVSESRLVPRSHLFWKEPKGKMTPRSTGDAGEGSTSRAAMDETLPEHSVQRKDKPSDDPESSESSVNNPKLLETVDDAIRRLILPEVTTLTKKQRALKSRDKSEQDQPNISEGSVSKGDDSGPKADLERPKGGHYAEAIHDSIPRDKTHIRLQKGRLVWIRSVMDDQWAVAEDTETGKTGLVPRNLLRIPRFIPEDKHKRGELGAPIGHLSGD